MGGHFDNFVHADFNMIKPLRIGSWELVSAICIGLGGLDCMNVKFELG